MGMRNDNIIKVLQIMKYLLDSSSNIIPIS